MSGRAEVDVLFLGRSDKAVRVRDARGVAHWLPLSEVDPAPGPDVAVGQALRLTLPEWLARARGVWCDATSAPG